MNSTKPVLPEIPFTRQFFDGYLVDHFLYKQTTMYNALQASIKRLPRGDSGLLDRILGLAWRKSTSFLTVRSLKGLKEIDYNAYVKSLRLEIRATYFQAVETLFELIFSLEPRQNVIDNRHIWYFLSTSKGKDNYKSIEKIASPNTAFLDRMINASDTMRIPFSQYLFYFGATDPAAQEAIRASLDPIKKFIVAFAEEFTDRDEYNAFKHALRILPTLQKVEYLDQSKKAVLALDMSTSMSYLQETEQSLSLRTKPLDTLRDMRMSQVCVYLISNIFRSRRAHFTKNFEGHLHTFTEESFSSATERNVKWTGYDMTLTPVYDKESQS